MARNKLHFLLRNLGTAHRFQEKRGGRGKQASDVPNRAAHAQVLLQAIDALPDIQADGLPGVYLEVTAPADEPLKKDSLNKSDLTLLHYDEGVRSGTNQKTATVYATASAIEKLRTKVTQFETENTPDREKDGQVIPGRPKNANLIQSIATLTEAGLRALWRSPADKFPQTQAATNWELWLDREVADAFILGAQAYGVAIGQEQLEFPEDIVVIAHGTRDTLANAIRHLRGVKAMAAPAVTADFFAGGDIIDQAQWVGDLRNRTTYLAYADPGYVTLLDTGVSRAHPLVQPALEVVDRHAANPAWGLEDIRGHGTHMAGLALLGDLTSCLHQTNPVTVSNRLESVKLKPDTGENPHHLFGAVTRDGVNTVEQTHPRRRTFTMPITTGADTPHDGAPTSWSSEIDQLASGASGDRDLKRLMLISVGNTDNFSFGAGQYLDRCDHEDNEIQSPAQAWNALAIGSFTEKTVLPDNEAATALAPFGDLSPSSRTASWSSSWPLKPDVVLEGGNWASSEFPPPMRHGNLSLLSTHHNYPVRSLTITSDTSAATALAAKGITELWTDYPDLWPETIRGLYVSSARWTQQMRRHLPSAHNKGNFVPLFQRYGYGVPNLERARRSASNALTLIVEDTITPYGLSDDGKREVNNEMKLFTLPWPVEELRRLGNTDVTLRVTLSSFIEPNPSEAARGSRYRYASHNLRFKLNRADEAAPHFMARISKLAEKPVGPASNESDGWDYGSDRRDVGSLHIDQLTCRASNLARRNLIAVHPVNGWWRTKSLLNGDLPSVRYALIVEINAEHVEAELHAEVQTAIAALAETQAVITV